MLFIVGSTRSGTTWLHTMLGEHSQVATTVEMTTFPKYIGPVLKIWNEEKKNYDEHLQNQVNIETSEGVIGGLPALWSEREYIDFLRSFLAVTNEKYMFKNPQASHILEKAPDNSLFTNEIFLFYENAKFIHMIRDGRDAVCSKIAAKTRVGFGPTSVQEATESWKTYVLGAQKARLRGVDRYLEVRYENLLQSPHEELEKILSFCELKYNSLLIDTIVSNNTFDKMKNTGKTADREFRVNSKFFFKGKSGNWRTDLSPDQQYIFSRIAGELLVDLGYVSDNEWWYSSIGQKYKLECSFIFRKFLVEFLSLGRSIFRFLSLRWLGHR